MPELILAFTFAGYIAVVCVATIEMFGILFGRRKEQEFKKLESLEPLLLSKGFKPEVIDGQFNTYIKRLGNIEIIIERIFSNIRITIKGGEQVRFSFPEESILLFLDYPDKILQERLNFFSQYMLSCLKNRLPELERNGPNYIS